LNINKCTDNEGKNKVSTDNNEHEEVNAAIINSNHSN